MVQLLSSVETDEARREIRVRCGKASWERVTGRAMVDRERGLSTSQARRRHGGEDEAATAQ
jgi:hypothetical protein